MSSMDYMFGVYRMTQTEYLDNLFSGADNGSLAQLEGLIANGMMNELPDNIDLTDVTEYFVKVITAQLIPKAWNLNRRRYTPFVL